MNEWTQESWERGNPEVQYKNKLDNKVVRKLTLSFTPYPLFQWYLQSKEIFIKFEYEMLKLSI
jgi:hypothetical protein